MIIFDKRGTGLSDRVDIATLEERMDDVRAVMDAVGSEQAALFGISEGGEMSMRKEPEPDRVLKTILFTDIVDSTKRAAELGDQRWRDLLDNHVKMTRRELARFRGQEIKNTGDGILATFDGPARGIRCARAMGDSMNELGIKIRSGLHTGECELTGDDISGIAVHIGARVSAHAGPDEVVVSQTVKDLVAGSGLQFQDLGMHTLKGVPGEWGLHAVER